MKRFLLLSIIFFLAAGPLFTQEDLIIRHGAKGFYLDHKVMAKENFYSIGRLYHTHPRNIAGFNNLDMTKGLGLGQMLKIPLTDTNFVQAGNRGIPVYYIVNENESLEAASRKNNKVPVPNLRNWNNLPGNNLSPRTKIIVGFLVTNEMQDRVVIIPERENESTVLPAVEKKPEVVVKNPDPVVKKEESQKTVTAAVKKEEKIIPSGAGYFKAHFDQQVKRSPVTKEQTVTSGIFKTTSGWQDAKYYMLMDKVEPGTIVKITNPTNNKIIFAKVLYAMEGIRQNQGLDIRISNAAASALDIGDTDKFIVKVNY